MLHSGDVKPGNPSEFRERDLRQPFAVLGICIIDPRMLGFAKNQGTRSHFLLVARTFEAVSVSDEAFRVGLDYLYKAHRRAVVGRLAWTCSPFTPLVGEMVIPLVRC